MKKTITITIEIDVPEDAAIDISSPDLETSPIPKITIYGLGLSKRVVSALIRENIDNINQLVLKIKEDWGWFSYGIRGLGPQRKKELIKFLVENNYLEFEYLDRLLYFL
mgnify:CR=1 FL=1